MNTGSRFRNPGIQNHDFRMSTLILIHLGITVSESKKYFFGTKVREDIQDQILVSFETTQFIRNFHFNLINVICLFNKDQTRKQKLRRTPKG